MIKYINLSPKLLAIASYYTQILAQFDKFSLFFLSPHSYAKLSINLFPLHLLVEQYEDFKRFHKSDLEIAKKLIKYRINDA